MTEQGGETSCYGIVRDARCELKSGHKGKHRNGGVTWTDGGAERIAKEDLEAKEGVAAKQ
jgi:hypothetical protein